LNNWRFFEEGRLTVDRSISKSIENPLPKEPAWRLHEMGEPAYSVTAAMLKIKPSNASHANTFDSAPRRLGCTSLKMRSSFHLLFFRAVTVRPLNYTRRRPASLALQARPIAHQGKIRASGQASPTNPLSAPRPFSPRRRRRFRRLVQPSSDSGSSSRAGSAFSATAALPGKLRAPPPPPSGLVTTVSRSAWSAPDRARPRRLRALPSCSPLPSASWAMSSGDTCADRCGRDKRPRVRGTRNPGSTWRI